MPFCIRHSTHSSPVSKTRCRGLGFTLRCARASYACALLREGKRVQHRVTSVTMPACMHASLDTVVTGRFTQQHTPVYTVLSLALSSGLLFVWRRAALSQCLTKRAHAGD